jgi:hypothetical protein
MCLEGALIMANALKSKIKIISLAILLTACSGYRKPESIESKMARFKQRSINQNQTPKVKASEFYGVKNRAPASTKVTVENTVDYSNKKLYFLTLFNQYESLKKFSKNHSAPKINLCPNFHTSLLKHQVHGVNENSNHLNTHSYNFDQAKLSDPGYASMYPELFLPVTENSLRPRVIDVIGKKNGSGKNYISQAIQIHLSKTYKELTELCEYGSSDNYYAFENLITETVKSSRYKLTSNSDSMSVLLKTTLYFNQALIASLKDHGHQSSGRVPASARKDQSSKFISYVNTRLQVHWVKDYFSHISKRRRSR